jgi:uncharacterized transporter YbjL
MVAALVLFLQNEAASKGNVAAAETARVILCSASAVQGTWANNPSAIQIFSIHLIAIGYPSGHFVQDVRNPPPQPAAGLYSGAAVDAAPALVAHAKSVARAPGGNSRNNRALNHQITAAGSRATAITLLEVPVWCQQA